MEFKFGNINSQKDTHVSILLHLKSNRSIEVEVNNIVSGNDVDIIVKDYFQNSKDFQKLLTRVSDQKEIVIKLNKENEETYFEKRRLASLEKALIDFKVGALRLAETFLSITTKSEKLKKAQDCFERGLILEADKILVEAELAHDQEALIAKMEYLQHRKKLLFEALLKIKKN